MVGPLSRSPSLPLIFHTKFNKENKAALKPHLPGTSETPSGANQQEDDLDIIKQIIDKDQLLDRNPVALREGVRSHSLSHIPGEFSNEISTSSLPILHHTESLTLLHTNYSSAPQLHSSLLNFEVPTSVDRQLHSQLNTLSHESQDLDEFLSTHQVENPPANFALQDRRGSGFSTHSLPTPVYNAQTTPSSFETQFDYSVRRESGQSSSIYSDLENRTPGMDGMDYSHRDSISSTTIPEPSKSFQFPSPPGSNTASILSSSLSQDDSLSRLLAPEGGQGALILNQNISSPTPITRIENLSVGRDMGFCDHPFGGGGGEQQLVHIAPEAELLSPVDEREERGLDGLGEFSISKEVNQHVAGEEKEEEEERDEEEGLPMEDEDRRLSSSDCMAMPGKKEKKTKAKTTSQPQVSSRIVCTQSTVMVVCTQSTVMVFEQLECLSWPHA